MPDDRRIIKTRKKLYHALGELTKESSFDKITVSDIINESGISRKTFYNHYQDKIDLVQEYQKEISDTIQQIFAQHTDPGNALIVKLAIFLNTQDYLLTALLSYNGSL
jgi:AcrR family transcriptional regulator